MISYSDALKMVEETACSFSESERLPVLEALGRILAKPAKSRVSNPPFRASAMDGFAIVSAQTKGASLEQPLKFKVAGILAAGDAALLSPNGLRESIDVNSDEKKAVEIMTGAVVPDFCDAVARIEEVTVEKNESGETAYINIVREIVENSNVRMEGEDFLRDKSLIPAGTLLLPHHLMICHAAGIGAVDVYRQPLVSILSTGAELVECSASEDVSLPPGMIFNSCGTFLRFALPRFGAQSSYFGTVADEPEEFGQTIKRMIANGADVIITTGAVSKGRFDFVPEIIKEIGAEILFHKAAIRPGKPLLFAKIKTRSKQLVFFCLPGNPVAVLTGVRFFVDPYLRKLSGRLSEEFFTARLTTSVKIPQGLTRFCLGTVNICSGGAEFSAHNKQQSFMLSPVVQSTAWAVLPSGRRMLEPGEEVQCRFLYPYPE